MTGAGQAATAPHAAAARPCVLVFAGIDPSGGAGLGADLQAVAAQGAHALTVVTALTVQDNDRVHGVQPVEADLVLRQARALTHKIVVGAVKIGIPGSAANALAIAQVIGELRARWPQLPVVLDPVLASGHGDTLARGDALAALAPLLPLATLLTPNGPEAAALSGQSTPAAQARALRALGCRDVLITGGHDGDDEVVNRWFGPGAASAVSDPQQWRWPRLDGGFHGSGCTLASAIAAQLALGLPTGCALELAQHYCYLALRDAYSIAPGQRIPLR
jgi:hydroxymethylpyrimidine/phosphomethylpyrimidine kinase